MSEVPELWRRYFLEGYDRDLTTISEDAPDTHSVYVDLVSLHEFDKDLTRAIFKNPDDVLDAGATVLNEITTVSGKIYLRVKNNPHHCTVSEVDAGNLYDLVTVEGRIESVGPVQASLDSAVYECPACEHRTSRSATGIEAPEPHYCESCGWTGPFSLVPSESTFIDLQATELRPPERGNGKTGSSPLRAYLTGDIVEAVEADSEYYLTGILRANRSNGLNAFDPYLSVLNLGNEQPASDPGSFKEAIDSRFGI